MQILRNIEKWKIMKEVFERKEKKYKIQKFCELKFKI